MSGNLEIQEGCIGQREDCEKACDGVEVVAHQAAYGSIPRSIKYPTLYSHINSHGFVNMVHAAHQAGISRFVYASSSSIYGDSTVSPKVEGVTGRPLSPYAASKISNEMFAHAFAHAHGMTMIGLRYFNVFGRRQGLHGAYAAAIPLFVHHLLNRSAPTIYGDGEQSRDFTYIDNVIEANMRAIFTDISQDSYVFNVACGHSTSVNELFRNIASILKSNIQPMYADPRTGDVRIPGRYRLYPQDFRICTQSAVAGRAGKNHRLVSISLEKIESNPIKKAYQFYFYLRYELCKL